MALRGVLDLEDRQQRLDRGGGGGGGAQQAGGVGAGLVDRLQDLGGDVAVAPTRRDDAEQVAADGVEAGLVDRLPAGHQVAEASRRPSRRGGSTVSRPFLSSRKPCWSSANHPGA